MDSNKISSALVGEKLSDIFIDTLSSPDELHKFKKNFQFKQLILKPIYAFLLYTF